MLFRGGTRELSEPSPELGFNSREADLRCPVTTEDEEPPAPTLRFFFTALVNRSVIGSLLTSGLVSRFAGTSFSSWDILRRKPPPPLVFSMSDVLLNMSFAGEAGGEIKLTGGTVRVNGSPSFFCHGGVDTGLSIGGGDIESALDAFNRGDCESKVGPSVKPAVLGEV